MATEIPVPRHDFYQSATHITVSLYIKGYGASAAREGVNISYGAGSVDVTLPPLDGESSEKHFTLAPLAGHIVPGECSDRVLGTKIELKLVKDEPVTWPSVVGKGEPLTQAPAPTPVASTSSSAPVPKPQKKNWDKLVSDLDEDDSSTSEPNAGGDAALQKMFASIYGNADEDTKRAMIKSFTESGGTTLSTDWSQVGKDKVEVRPPDGMYEMKM